jgi:hypothetical protein
MLTQIHTCPPEEELHNPPPNPMIGRNLMALHVTQSYKLAIPTHQKSTFSVYLNQTQTRIAPPNQNPHTKSPLIARRFRLIKWC